jgi:cobalt-zinc-cadmium efflux system protein
VIAAAIIISVTGWYPADSIMAAVIGAIILWGAVQVVAESADILLEAVPRHIRVDLVVEAIKSE